MKFGLRERNAKATENYERINTILQKIYRINVLQNVNFMKQIIFNFKHTVTHIMYMWNYGMIKCTKSCMRDL